MKAQKLTKETIRDLGVDTGKNIPDFNPGDAVRVSLRVIEGNKERIQHFEGDVIAINKNGASSTFTVRRIAANGIAVERIFPFYSPRIAEIKFVRAGDVRRAKIYYIRERIGKAARVKEKILTHEEKERLKSKNAKKAAKKVEAAAPAEKKAVKNADVQPAAQEEKAEKE